VANPLPNYEDLGFNKFLQRSIKTQNTQTQSQSNFSSGLNFDQVQMSGSLGDKIQVGGNNIIIDGVNRRITINDGNNDVITIGDVS